MKIKDFQLEVFFGKYEFTASYFLHSRYVGTHRMFCHRLQGAIGSIENYSNGYPGYKPLNPIIADSNTIICWLSISQESEASSWLRSLFSMVRVMNTYSPKKPPLYKMVAFSVPFIYQAFWHYLSLSLSK